MNLDSKFKEKVLKIHADLKGKVKISPLKNWNRDLLKFIYTPGVATVCKEIQRNKQSLYKYTIKQNTVAIISNGTAVLGLGNIGSGAALPVIEGKAILLKQLAGVNAYPICISERNPKKLCEIIKKISVNFGAIMLEDIKAPECIEIEKTLEKQLDIPVLHDDQWGTAIVVFAALKNALKVVAKKIDKIKVVILGCGAAGSAITKLLLAAGVKEIIVVDLLGIINEKDETTMKNKLQTNIAQVTNRYYMGGSISDALEKADVFIGVSSGGALENIDIGKLMNEKPIVFALANPVPEINPLTAKKKGAYIVATGRSDYENQINNILSFPGFFKALIESRIRKIPMKMKLVAAEALANVIPSSELCQEKIIPDVFDEKVIGNIVKAVLKFVEKNERKD